MKSRWTITWKCHWSLTAHHKIRTVSQFTLRLFFKKFPCSSFSFLPPCLQFCFYCIHLKYNFPRCLVNQSNVPLTTITSRQSCLVHVFPLCRRATDSGRREGTNASPLTYVHDRDGARWELLCCTHVDGSVKTAGKFPWASSNWKLIIFSLGFLSNGVVGGRRWGPTTAMRPGVRSWQRLRRRSVPRSRCEVELGPSARRSVWDLSARDRVCDFLVRVGKCLQSAELIEYSMYQVYVHVAGLCCAANAAPMEGLDADTAREEGRRRMTAARSRATGEYREERKEKNKWERWGGKKSLLLEPLVVHQQVAAV